MPAAVGAAARDGDRVAEAVTWSQEIHGERVPHESTRCSPFERVNAICRQSLLSHDACLRFPLRRPPQLANRPPADSAAPLAFLLSFTSISLRGIYNRTSFLL